MAFFLLFFPSFGEESALPSESLESACEDLLDEGELLVVDLLHHHGQQFQTTWLPCMRIALHFGLVSYSDPEKTVKNGLTSSGILLSFLIYNIHRGPQILSPRKVYILSFEQCFL